MAQNQYNRDTYTNAATYGGSNPPSFSSGTSQSSTRYIPSSHRESQYWANNPNNPEYWTQDPRNPNQTSSRGGCIYPNSTYEPTYSQSQYIPPEEYYSDYDEEYYSDDDRGRSDRRDGNESKEESKRDKLKRRAASADPAKATTSVKETKSRFDNLDIALIFGTVALSFGATFAGRKLAKSRNEKGGRGEGRGEGRGSGGARR